MNDYILNGHLCAKPCFRLCGAPCCWGPSLHFDNKQKTKEPFESCKIKKENKVVNKCSLKATRAPLYRPSNQDVFILSSSKLKHEGSLKFTNSDRRTSTVEITLRNSRNPVYRIASGGFFVLKGWSSLSGSSRIISTSFPQNSFQKANFRFLSSSRDQHNSTSSQNQFLMNSITG